MADDFQVKQGVNTQSSSGAYGLTGAAIGALGGGLGAHYITKPKYGSYEDIINESKDSFDKKVENAPEEDKKFLDDAKELRGKKDAALAEYDTKLEEYKKTHGTGKIETDDYKKLVGEETEAKNKVAELEKAAGNKTEAVTGTVKKDPLQVIRQKVRALDDAREELKQLKADNAPKESIDKVNQRIKNLEKGLNEAYDKIVESIDFDKATKKETEAAKKAFRAELEGYAQEYGRVRDKFNSKLPEKKYKIAKANIEKEEKAITDALAKIKELTAHKGTIEGQDFAGYDLTEALKNNRGFNPKGHVASRVTKFGVIFTPQKNVPAFFNTEMETILNIEANKTNVLEKLLKDYAKVGETATDDSISSFVKRLGHAWDYVIHNKPIPTEIKDKESLVDFIKHMKDKEKEAVEKIIKGENVTKETIEGLINASKERTKGLTEAAKSIRASRASIGTLEKTIKDRQTEVVEKYGKGAYINEEGIICKKGKPIEKAKTPQMKLPEFKTTSGMELPKEIEVAGNSAAGESAELKQARKTLAEIQEKVKTMYEGLKDGEAKSAEQVEKEFCETLKVADKEAYGKQQLENAKKEFVEKYAEKLKRRFGFAEGFGWKAAGVAAAGALVIGGIASMLAPKDKA